METEAARRFWMPFYGAYARALAKYIPKPYAGRVVMYLCAKERTQPFDPRLMWRKVVKGGIEVHRIPGTHRTMMQEPSVRLLADHLRAHLAQADAAASP